MNFNQRMNPVARGTMLLANKDNDGLSEEIKSIIKNMRHDKVSLYVNNDDLIKKYGDSLCEKYAGLTHLKNDIAQKMRELARMMIEIESGDNPVRNLRDALQPHNFTAVVKSVKQLCSLDDTESKKLTLALKIGYSLQKCLAIVKSEAIMEGNDAKQKGVQDFQALYDIHWIN